MSFDSLFQEIKKNTPVVIIKIDKAQIEEPKIDTILSEDEIYELNKEGIIPAIFDAGDYMALTFFSPPVIEYNGVSFESLERRYATSAALWEKIMDIINFRPYKVEDAEVLSYLIELKGFKAIIETGTSIERGMLSEIEYKLKIDDSLLEAYIYTTIAIGRYRINDPKLGFRTAHLYYNGNYYIHAYFLSVQYTGINRRKLKVYRLKVHEDIPAAYPDLYEEVFSGEIILKSKYYSEDRETELDGTYIDDFGRELEEVVKAIGYKRDNIEFIYSKRPSKLPYVRSSKEFYRVKPKDDIEKIFYSASKDRTFGFVKLPKIVPDKLLHMMVSQG